MCDSMRDEVHDIIKKEEEERKTHYHHLCCNLNNNDNNERTEVELRRPPGAAEGAAGRRDSAVFGCPQTHFNNFKGTKKKLSQPGGLIQVKLYYSYLSIHLIRFMIIFTRSLIRCKKSLLKKVAKF